MFVFNLLQYLKLFGKQYRKYIIIRFYIDEELIDLKSFIFLYIKIKKKNSYKLQIKYDINALDFMIKEHAICIVLNTIFWLTVVKM